ncbi:MAG: DNA glycosylase AlkZ-like family protein [Acidimicrobiales bacterium]
MDGAAAHAVRALRERRLLVVYGARGTLMLVPAADVAVFTVGSAPADETSLRAAIPGAFLRRLDDAGITATAALQTVIDAVAGVLAGGPLPRGDTAMAVTRAVPATLAPPCRGRCPDPHVEDSLFRLAGVSGVMGFDADADVLVTLDGRLRAEGSRQDARAELVHRYLRCYGPSTPAALAEWAGIGKADARRSLASLAGGTVEVTVDGSPAGVMLRADAEQAGAAASASLRFLPAFDAYLLARDRSMLVPDRASQRVVWRSAGNPAVVVIGGEPVATWTARRQGKRTAIRITPLGAPFPVDADDLQEEATRLAAARDAAGPVEVTVDR